jgi:hypothetical protein
MEKMRKTAVMGVYDGNGVELPAFGFVTVSS